LADDIEIDRGKLADQGGARADGEAQTWGEGARINSVGMPEKGLDQLRPDAARRRRSSVRMKRLRLRLGWPATGLVGCAAGREESGPGSSEQ